MKGQTQALTTVLVTTVIVGAAASTYVWGKPLIDKRQGEARADKMEKNSVEMSRAVTQVAESGSGNRIEFKINIPEGSLIVNEREDYIQIETSIKNAPYSTKWTNLRGNSKQNTSYNEGIDPARIESILAPAAVKKQKDDNTVKYRVDFRNVKQSENSLRRIDIETIGDNRGNGKMSLLFTNEGTQRSSDYEIDNKKFRMRRNVIEVDIQ